MIRQSKDYVATSPRLTPEREVIFPIESGLIKGEIGLILLMPLIFFVSRMDVKNPAIRQRRKLRDDYFDEAADCKPLSVILIPRRSRLQITLS